MSKTTILLSHERSGSHFVSGFLASLDGVGVLDEVCNPRAIEPQYQASFHGFRFEYATQNPDFLRSPDHAKQAEFTRAYFNRLHSGGDGNALVVDIKYAHLHLFEFFWCPAFERPFLLKHGQHNDFRFVHLYRQNVVEAAVSAAVAEARKVWHSTDAPAKCVTVDIHVTAVVKAARLLEQQNLWFREQFASQPRVMTLTYERAAKELGKGGELDNALARHVGGEITAPYVSKYEKVTPPIAEVVRNYSELADACVVAGLGAFVM